MGRQVSVDDRLTRVKFPKNRRDDSIPLSGIITPEGEINREYRNKMQLAYEAPDISTVPIRFKQRIRAFRYAKSIGELADELGLTKAMVKAVIDEIQQEKKC